MKKYIVILATLMIITVGCLMAQNHRHTDRSNEAAVESIANVNNAAEIIDATDVEDEFEDMIEMSDMSSHRDSEEISIAKTAIYAILGFWCVIFISPALIVLIILYFKHKKNVMKNKLAMAAIEKGVAVPDMNDLTNTEIKENNTTNNIKTDMKMTNRYEKAVKQLALAVGFGLGGFLWHVDVLMALGAAFAIYGIGLICIAIFVDKDDEKLK